MKTSKAQDPQFPAGTHVEVRRRFGRSGARVAWDQGEVIEAFKHGVNVRMLADGSVVRGVARGDLRMPVLHHAPVFPEQQPTTMRTQSTFTNRPFARLARSTVQNTEQKMDREVIENAAPSVSVRDIVQRHGRFLYNECGVECWRLDVTPEIAKQLLVFMDPHQRKLNRRDVLIWSDSMSSNRWLPMVDAIWGSLDGLVLYNANHRLHGVVESGTTQTFEFKFADRSKYALVLDSGRKRSIADGIRIVLKAQSVPKVVSAAIMFRTFGEPSDWRSTTYRASPEEKMWLVADHSLRADLESLMSAGKLTTGLATAAIMAMEANRGAALKFFGAVTKNDPRIDGVYFSQVHVLSSWLITQKRGGVSRMREELHRSVSAYNAWRQQREISQTRYSAKYNIPKALP